MWDNNLLPFNMWDNNRFAPPCWGTPPVALNLSRAFHGEDKRQRLGSVVENLKREIRSLSIPSVPRPRIQTLAYKAFVSHFVPDDVDALLIRRLAVISNFPFSSFDRLDLQSITACLQCTDKFLAMCVGLRLCVMGGSPPPACMKPTNSTVCSAALVKVIHYSIT